MTMPRHRHAAINVQDYIQDLVPVKGVQVQVLSSALLSVMEGKGFATSVLQALFCFLERQIVFLVEGLRRHHLGDFDLLQQEK